MYTLNVTTVMTNLPLHRLNAHHIALLTLWIHLPNISLDFSLEA